MSYYIRCQVPGKNKWVSVAIPFINSGNRQFLFAQQLAEVPELAEFVKRFYKCFDHDPIMDVYWFDASSWRTPDGDENDNK